MSPSRGMSRLIPTITMELSLMNRNCRLNYLLFAVLFACFGLPVFSAGAQDPAAQSSSAANGEPPMSWVDPDTGHRVIRLTPEPGSDSFYFNYNCFTPDGKKMAYTTTNGISVLNLETLQSTPVVTNKAHTIIVGHKSSNLYYTRDAEDPMFHTLWCVNLDT